MSDFLLNDIRRGFYLDSVALMRISRGIAAAPGVREAALMMGTPSNREIMANAGLLGDEAADARGNDLIIGVRAVGEAAARAALASAIADLEKPRQSAISGAGEARRPRTLHAAVAAHPGLNLALISVPGDFAAAEARKALNRGLHAMIFSDNVPVAQERALKEEARRRGLLVMGPDCGTAIINGVPLAFANRVRRGSIGVIGASGTGIQEVTSLIARAGAGVSHAIGVGGRDLSQAVGAITTQMAIEALDADPQTETIVIISKPPHPDVAKTVLDRVACSRKPFVICFLGARDIATPRNTRFAPTLKRAAELALGADIAEPAPDGASTRRSGKGRLIGLYAGGTLCAEAQLVLLDHGRRPASNAPVPGASKLVDAESNADRMIDLGADEYTRGRPHPMIDPSVRDDMLLRALAEPDVGAILVDMVIGFGAHADPAGHFAAILSQANGKTPPIVASVTGTDEDFQGRARQIATLEAAGVLVAPSNAQAAELAVSLCQG